MAIEVNAASSICRKCGTAYSRLKGYFPVSYSYLYKGTGYLPYCKECVDGMYNAYLVACQDPKKAVRQMCRKLDLYWNERIYEAVEKQNAARSMMTSYISKINALKQAGKSYDDTLTEEGVLWLEPKSYATMPEPTAPTVEEDNEVDVPEDVAAFWGPGYTPSMYMELEQRRSYWMSRHPAGVDMDIGTEALIRQICNLEIDINRDRAAGKSVEKSVNVLNTLLGSASLKPAQKKDESDAELEKMPLGVGIQKWEFDRPLPATDKDKRDVRDTIKNITIWYLGHACKMVGLKNGYSKMYEEAMEELRVKRPEMDEEDDEDVLNDFFKSPGGST